MTNTKPTGDAGASPQLQPEGLQTLAKDGTTPSQNDHTGKEGQPTGPTIAEAGQPPTTPGERNEEEGHIDAKGHNLLYTEEEFEVNTAGTAGRLVQKLGPFAYALFFVFPLAYVAIFFAIVPLGDPLIETIREQWVFLFISNLSIMMAIAFLYNATFLSLAKCQHPFRTSLIPLVSIVVMEVILMTPI